MRNLTVAIAALACLLGAAAASPAQEANSATPATILADLRQNSLSAEEIQGVTSLPSMRVVSLDAFSGTDVQELQATLKDTEDGFAEVQSAIEANENLEARLSDRGIEVSSVVAMTRGDDEGPVTLYIDESASP